MFSRGLSPILQIPIGPTPPTVFTASRHRNESPGAASAFRVPDADCYLAVVGSLAVSAGDATRRESGPWASRVLSFWPAAIFAASRRTLPVAASVVME